MTRRSVNAPGLRPRSEVHAGTGTGAAYRDPGAGAPAHRPAPRRRGPGPAHSHLHLRVPGLAAGHRRPHHRAQHGPDGGPRRGVGAGRERGAGRHRGVGQPGAAARPARPPRRRGGHVVRQGAGRGPLRRRVQARQLQGHRRQRRGARAGRRRPDGQVVDAAHPGGAHLLRRPDAGALSRLDAGDHRPRTARHRPVQVFRPVDRVQGGDHHRRRVRHRRGGPRPGRPHRSRTGDRRRAVAPRPAGRAWSRR